MSDEWGPWIEHDGKGCPFAAGVVVEAVGEWEIGRFVRQVYRVAKETPSWDWRNWGRRHADGRKIMALRRYRIRKPRALLDLIERVRELDDAPQGPVRVPGKEVVG